MKIRIINDSDLLTLSVGDVLDVISERDVGYVATDGYEEYDIDRKECEVIE